MPSARDYGFQIDPTPVRSPEKKGKVERDAQHIENVPPDEIARRLAKMFG